MWELMRDWLTEKGYCFKQEPVWPANQTFIVHKDKSKLVQTWRVYPEIEVMKATGNPHWPYEKIAKFDARDPECFQKLEKLL